MGMAADCTPSDYGRQGRGVTGSWLAVFRMVFWGLGRVALRGGPRPAQVFTVFSARCSVFARNVFTFRPDVSSFRPDVSTFSANFPKCVHSGRRMCPPGRLTRIRAGRGQGSRTCPLSDVCVARDGCPEDLSSQPALSGDPCVTRAWLRGRPLTGFGRRRPNLPLPLERVKSRGPEGDCPWWVGCPEDLSSQPSLSGRPLRNPGLVARKTPHRFRPGTAESASPLGEGEEPRPRRSLIRGGLVARKTLTPTLSHGERGKMAVWPEGWPGLLAAAQGDVAGFVQVQAVELAADVGAVRLADVGHELPEALAGRVVVGRSNHHFAVERHDFGSRPRPHRALIQAQTSSSLSRAATASTKSCGSIPRNSSSIPEKKVREMVVPQRARDLRPHLVDSPRQKHDPIHRLIRTPRHPFTRSIA